MKILALLILLFLLLSSGLSVIQFNELLNELKSPPKKIALDETKKEKISVVNKNYTPSPPITKKVKKQISVNERKKHFFHLVVPEVQKVYTELSIQYEKVKKDLAEENTTQGIEELKALYKVKSDEALLLALKPHPISIVLAQAAVESAWATSRFSLEANNLFGMWSINTNENRVAASQKRGGKRTIWLKKFASIEDSIRDYYLTIGRAKAYKKLREYRMQTDNVYEIIKGLNTYSELGEEYVKIIRGVISYNKLTKYDTK